VWPASHNAMASAAYDFLGAEQTETIPEQLNAGIRFLMIDAYYGYDDNGLVRTNLAGGVNRDELRAERGDEAVHELDRLGALTGVADTSGQKQDVYFCHDFCELGAIPSKQVFNDIDAFLSRNLTDVVVMDVEDYVQPKDLKRALVEGGLWDRVWKPNPKHIGWPTLDQMVEPRNDDDAENPQRLIVTSEKHAGEAKWLIGTYEISGESTYAVPTSASKFDCSPKRGGTDKSFLIINHWLKSNGPPDPVAANNTNSQKVLTQRFQQCIAKRKQLPNTIAVNFTSQGDLFKTVNRYNAAIARQSGVTPMVTKVVKQLRDRDGISASELRELNGLHRLPKISEKAARTLLGALADRVPTPVALRTFASPCPPGTHAASKAEIKAAKKAEKAAPSTTTTTSATTTTTLAPDGSAPAPEPTTTTLPPSGTVRHGCAVN